MRRTGLILAGIAFLFSSCTEEFTSPSLNGGGEVVISLTSSEGTNTVPGVRADDTRSSSDPLLPDIADFEVEIYNSSGIRLYRDTYEATEGRKIPLNAGEYRLLAQWGDSTGIGFNSIWYAADKTFTVHEQTVEELSAVAKMSKVKVAVKYGTNLKLEYSQYHSRVRLDGSATRYLKFEKDETRAGYMPAGSIGYEFYAIVDGEWKYYPAEPVECNPNDFVTFYAELNTGTGNLDLVTVRTDDSMNVIEKHESIPADAAPKDPPVITLYGFDDNNSCEVTEAVDKDWLQADIEARAGVKSFTLRVKSDYLASLGVPQDTDIDLSSADLDPAVREALRSVGIRWPRSLAGERFANLDFSDVPNSLRYDPANGFSAEFTLTVKDELDRSASEAFSVNEVAPSGLSFTVEDWNAYARSIRYLSSSIQVGNPSAVALQYRRSGSGDVWTDVVPASVSGTAASYSDIAGLAPSTSYELRAIYNHNENVATSPVTLQTEAATQFPNSGFEEWTDEMFNFELGWSIFSRDKSIEWYRPWLSGGEERWWDVNSKYTMPGNYSWIDLNQNTANFPSVGYTVSDVYAGTKSAKLFTVWVGYSVDQVNRLSRGELFAGTANDDGTHASEGRSFGSRPSSIEFAYKYTPAGDEKFYMLVQLRDASNNVFSSTEITDGPAASTWQRMTVPLSYSDNTKKAASVYVIFKSSSSSAPSYSEQSITLGANDSGGENLYSSGCNIGSILYLDDISLVYE